MPELPEVETIRGSLADLILNLKIKHITVLNPNTFQGDFTKLYGKTVQSVWRRGKVLGVSFGEDQILLFHLKMTGQLILEKSQGAAVRGGHPTGDMENPMPIKSTRVIIEFESPFRLAAGEAGGAKLYFNDQRKFGWIKLVSSEWMVGDSFLSKMGPEPLSSDFTLSLFRNNLNRHPQIAIKAAILDQSVVAGVGNIYASEALYLAGILPSRKVKTLNDLEIKKLHQGIKTSLETGLKYGGSSRSHYVNTDGGKGHYLDYANVYERDNLPCKSCRTLIKKIKISGRGSYFCPECQV